MNKSTFGRCGLSILACLCFKHLLGHSIINAGQTNRSCEAKLTCEDLINSTNAPDDIYRHHCTCVDATSADCHDTSLPKSKVKLERNFTCVQMGQDGPKGVAMIATCLPGWEGGREKEGDKPMCDMSRNLSYFYPAQIITNIRTGVIYPNKFCAACNNETSRADLVASTLRMKCPEEARDWLSTKKELRFYGDVFMSWNPNITLWDVKFYGNNHSCVADLEVPESLRYFVNRCDESPIGKCRAKWRGSEIREKCKAYTYLIYAGSKLYANPHCALCNGEIAENLTCTKKIYFVNNNESLHSFKFYGDEVNSTKSDFIVYLEPDPIVYAVATIKWTKDERPTKIIRWSETLDAVTIICLSLSNLFLLLHLIVFSLIDNLRDLNGKNLASLCLAILMGNTSFLLFISTDEIEQTNCKLSSLFTYYGYLASFFWIQTIAFDIWHMLKRTTEFKKVSGEQWKRFLFYSAWSWLVPAIYTCAAFYFRITPKFHHEIDRHPFLTIRACLVRDSSYILFFSVPLAIIMFINGIFFLLSAYMLYVSTMRRSHVAARTSIKVTFVTYAKLASIMGLNGIIAMIACYLFTEFLWYVYFAFNSFQCIFIFVSFSCSEKGRIGLKKLFGCGNDPDRNHREMAET